VARANRAEKELLFSLLFEHVNEQLRRKSPDKLAAYLGGLRPWRVLERASQQPLAVYKTADQPCLAYTAFAQGADVVLLVLGVCRRYPSSEESWWTDVIRPRLVEHL
jgi:hypothetical protein